MTTAADALAAAWRPGPVDPAALERAAAFLARRCPGRVDRDRPLAPLTTFRLGGPARLFLEAHTLNDLLALKEALAGTGLPLLVIGRGSNLLVADSGWPGVTLHLGGEFRRITVEGTELEAGAATPLPALASRSAAAGLGGLAFAVAIPGTVGGGVRMNAGAHGAELGDRLLWAEVLQVAAPEGGRAPDRPMHPAHLRRLVEAAGPVRLDREALGLGYRRSALPYGAVVTAARFALEPAPQARVRAEIDEARRWRHQHQPVNQPNCGSVFANPDGAAAGWVIEQLGLKGARQGGARVSEIHANFIVTEPGARAADVLALIRRVQRRAREELGIALRTEVQLVGEFPPVDGEGGR